MLRTFVFAATLALSIGSLAGCTVEVRCFDAECDPRGNGGGDGGVGGNAEGGDGEGGTGAEGAAPTCGDDTKNGDEICDGPDLGGTTCEDIGQPPGALACTGDCTLFAGACNSTCGNEVLDPGEPC